MRGDVDGSPSVVVGRIDICACSVLLFLYFECIKTNKNNVSDKETRRIGEKADKRKAAAVFFPALSAAISLFFFSCNLSTRGSQKKKKCGSSAVQQLRRFSCRCRCIFWQQMQSYWDCRVMCVSTMVPNTWDSLILSCDFFLPACPGKTTPPFPSFHHGVAASVPAHTWCTRSTHI